LRSIVFSALLLFATPTLPADGPRLLLAGGALPVCSSANARHCLAGKTPGAAPLANGYRLDSAGIKRVAAGGWLPSRQRIGKRVVATLGRWHQRAGEVDFAAANVGDALTKSSEQDADLWAGLAEFERARVLDALQRAPQAEVVALDDSDADSGAVVFRELVAMARQVSGRQRPHLLLSTASSRDPFDAIAFYTSVFEQAGAEVRWLPLDHALRTAQIDRDSDCDHLDHLRGTLLAAHDRDRLYPVRASELRAACRAPEELAAAIRWADGVFLNGGDQSFTRAAWFTPDGKAPSAELQLLLQRLDAGTLVLGGSSAGTAVQSARPAATPPVMIISGAALPSTAATALTGLPPDPDCRPADSCSGIDPDALLYHPGGGLGSFPFGVLDTHFSNRGREYRLARLLLDTGSALGVGIDETTALRLDRRGDSWQGRVIGQGGVSVLTRLDAQRLLRRNYRSGSRLSLPSPAPTTYACEAKSDVDKVSGTVLADSQDLRQFIDAVGVQAHPLVLTQADRREPAGTLCSVDAGLAQLWDFTPVQK